MDGYVQVPLAVIMAKGLSVYAKAAFSVILAHADSNGVCNCGRALIADCLGVSVRRVDSYIKELVDRNVLEVIKRGVKKTNAYKVLECSDMSTETASKCSDVSTSSGVECSDMSSQNGGKCSDMSLKYNIKDALQSEDQLDDKMTGSKGENKTPLKRRAQSASRKSHDDISQEKIELARCGQLCWSKVTDRDITLYYIRSHNSLFANPIIFDRYRDVAVIRDALLVANSIPREKAVSFIETLLSEYHSTPNRHSRLSISMLANRTRDVVAVIEKARSIVLPLERRFRYNHFSGENGASATPAGDMVF